MCIFYWKGGAYSNPSPDKGQQMYMNVFLMFYVEVGAIQVDTKMQECWPRAFLWLFRGRVEIVFNSDF